ncbi:MAG: M24 family metallopeptidase, partial [Asgard group archaeon]|nr:M24 family metallopeptidase [Asgard group archaeon]
MSKKTKSGSSSKKATTAKKTSTTKKTTASKTTAKKTTSSKKSSATTKKVTTKKPTTTKKSTTTKKATTTKKTSTTKKSPAKTTTKKTTTKKPTTTKKTTTKKSTTTKKPTAKKTTTKKPTTSKKTTTTKTVTKPTTTKKVVKKKATKDEGPLEHYLKAGEISIKVKELLRKKVKVGASALEICEAGEAKIKELGGNWAFPLNVSINNVAAHYSSPPDDELIIRSGDIVKVDCGVEIDGYVADTAFTVSFNKEYNDLVKASEEATKAAIDMIRPGITTDRLGSEIEDIIRSYDYRPIRELTGHQLDQNLLHGPVT